MAQQLVDQKNNVYPGGIALSALGAEGAHCTDSRIPKNELKRGAVASISEVTRDGAHGVQVEFHALECPESVLRERGRSHSLPQPFCTVGRRRKMGLLREDL
jgi:hypothetical protein